MAKASVWRAVLLSLYGSGCDRTLACLDCDGANWQPDASGVPSLDGNGGPGRAAMHEEIDASTVVTMQRTGCYGPCPMYSVRISGDGAVAFNGENFVRLAGEATGQVPVADVERLVGAMLDANYFSLRSDGGCRPGDEIRFTTDAPGATTSLTLRERTNTIWDYHGNSCAPRVLRSIEDMIDEIAGTARWVQCDTSGGLCPDPLFAEDSVPGN